MIEFQHVAKHYPNGYEALTHVNFELASGEMTFLTGHSGAGKSTLLKLLMLMERPTQGKVVVAGQDLSKLGASRIPYYRRHIGVVFQDHQLLVDRTVFDNVALPLRICGFPEKDIGRRVRAALDKVGLLEREQYYPIALSGGEQQRVGIARAVVNKPPILLADEPTGNLDSHTGDALFTLLRQLNRSRGTTFVIVTHNDKLSSQADRIVSMQDGMIVSS